jgi:hypothetical protein
MGGYLSKISIPGIGYFNFWEDILYFIKDDKLEMIDLYTMEQESTKLPKSIDWQYVLIYEDIIYLLANGHLGKYQKK